MEKIFKEEHQVTYGDCDETGKIQLPKLIEHFMKVSNDQLTQGNAGIHDLLKQNLGWVVVEYHLDLERLPEAGEKITVTTNGSGYNRFFEYRDFGIIDSTNKKIVDVKSQWVILDLKNRKITEADSQMMEKFGNPYLKHMPRFKRLRPLKDYESSKTYAVRYYDLDTNHHLTNSVYFDWMIDTLPREFLNSHTAKSVDISFKKEVQYGDQALSELTLDQDMLTSYHLISNQGEISALAEISWREN